MATPGLPAPWATFALALAHSCLLAHAWDFYVAFLFALLFLAAGLAVYLAGAALLARAAAWAYKKALAVPKWRKIICRRNALPALIIAWAARLITLQAGWPLIGVPAAVGLYFHFGGYHFGRACRLVTFLVAAPIAGDMLCAPLREALIFGLLWQPCFGGQPGAARGRGACVKKGRGKGEALAAVRGMRSENMASPAIREKLKQDGFAKARVSQLLKETRGRPAGPAAPPAAPAFCDQVTMEGLDDSAAEAAVMAHAAAARPALREVAIPGDGNCLYRSVGFQTERGQEEHRAVRALAMEEVRSRRRLYITLFSRQSPRAAWLDQQARGDYGDEVSVRALCNVLERPVVVWRRHAPGQPPSCFVPEPARRPARARPIYLLHYEPAGGEPHYDAFARAPDPRPREPAPSTPKKSRPAAAPASSPGPRGLAGSPFKRRAVGAESGGGAGSRLGAFSPSQRRMRILKSRRLSGNRAPPAGAAIALRRATFGRSMAGRKRPAAALSCLPPIDDVRNHAGLVREIMAEYPDFGYRRVGALLGERLGVTLDAADLQVVLRLQKAEPMASDGDCSLSSFSGNVRDHVEVFTGDMRDHADAINALVVLHRGMGYKGIANEFARHFRVKLSQAHISVINRIVDGISAGRAVPGAQLQPENHDSVTFDVRDHSASIQELMMEDPGMDHQGVAHRLAERLQVALSDAQKQAIRGVMAQTSIQLMADDMAMPEQSDLEVFAVDVREHVDAIKELVASDPQLGYRRIGGKLGAQLGVKLSWANVLMVNRIMTELSEERLAVGVSIRQQAEPEILSPLKGKVRAHMATIKELMTQHSTAGYKRISVELGRRLGRALSDSHQCVIQRIMIGHCSLTYEFLCSPPQVSVVQGLVQVHDTFALRRQAVQDRYERGVSEAVLRRWMSEHYVPYAGACPVRRVWKDWGCAHV